MARSLSQIQQWANPKRDPVPTEHEEQVKFIKEFTLQFPELRIFAIPNGGKRSIKTAVDLKAEGVVKGVPDLFIPAKLLWIEMKRAKGGKLSPEQKDWVSHLQSVGHTVIIGYGCDDALDKVRNELSKV